MVEKNHSGQSYSDGETGHHIRTEHWADVRKLQRWFFRAGSEFISKDMDRAYISLQVHNDRRIAVMMMRDIEGKG